MPTETPERPAPRGVGAETAALIERALALGLVALLLGGILMVLAPFTMAILFGAFISIGTWPLRQALVARGLGRTKTAALLFLVVLLVVALPVLLIAPALPSQIGAAVELARQTIDAAPEDPPSWLAGLPFVGDHAAGLWVRVSEARTDLSSLIRPYYGQLGHMLVSIGTAAAESVLQIILSLIVTTMFWANGDALVETLRDAFGRIGGPAGAAAVDAAGGAVRGVAWGIVGTAALQGTIMAIGLAIGGVHGAVMLGFLTLVFSVSQVLSLLILVVWAAPAYLAFSAGHVGSGVIIVITGLIVGIADNVVRPLLISRGSAMPITLIILGVFGGLIAFGFLGLFVGPALLAVGHGLLKAWRGEVETPAA